MKPLKNLKKIKKIMKIRLDKWALMWYNKYRKKESGNQKCSNGLKKKKRKLLNT